MSSSVGAWWPFSSLEILDGGQASSPASSLPVNPALWRSSRSRRPSAWRACWTLVTPVVLAARKLIPPDGPVPGIIPPVTVLHHHSRIVDDLGAEEAVGVVEMHQHELATIEQPVVMVRQPRSLITAQVADVLPCGVGQFGAPQTEAVVVTQRHAHHAHPQKLLPLGVACPNKVNQFLNPGRLFGPRATRPMSFVIELVRVALTPGDAAPASPNMASSLPGYRNHG